MPERFASGYDLVTTTILGMLMLAAFVITAVLAVAVTIRGNWHGVSVRRHLRPDNVGGRRSGDVLFQGRAL